MAGLNYIKDTIAQKLKENKYLKSYKFKDIYLPEKREFPLEKPVICIYYKKIAGVFSPFDYLGSSSGVSSYGEKLSIVLAADAYFPPDGNYCPILTFESICEELFPGGNMGITSVTMGGVKFDKTLGAKVLNTEISLDAVIRKEDNRG